MSCEFVTQNVSYCDNDFSDHSTRFKIAYGSRLQGDRRGDAQLSN